MRILLISLIAAVCGTAIGAVSALWMGGLLSGGLRIGDSIKVDDWSSDWSIGSEAANPYVRARIARVGLLALRKEEAVYFNRAVDDEGRALTEACTYRVSAGALPAEWWSITLYDRDSRLPMNTDGALSFDATDAADLGDAGDWSFTISPAKGTGPKRQWVSSKAADVFDLTLRLYLPTDALLDDPAAALRPPRIERLSCEGGV
ncbi:DUF1214 domain-containing protein [Henriciella litoralis]|uniref:DUF1214 domain-containing protein n=1 Tax=Henriciella litoralis TaxID=568102 RepID=UPI0009FCD4B2|nr:DUF1214 domain-containing protein [Henriciella litoralis]